MCSNSSNSSNSLNIYVYYYKHIFNILDCIRISTTTQTHTLNVSLQKCIAQVHFWSSRLDDEYTSGIARPAINSGALFRG